MTSPIRRRSLICIGAALAALLAPASAVADDVVATLARDTPIAAFGGVVAWSDYDAASARHHLVLRQGDRAARAPIADAARPFDVSLGPDARGRVVALYTRCRRAARGCDVYRYDFKTRREHKLSAVSSPKMDEAWPVQWRDRVAFVRRARTYVMDGYDHRPDPRGKRGGGPLMACDVPYVKTLSARATSRRLDRGHCGTTTGLSIRGDSIVQVSDEDQGGAGSETQVRGLRARGGPARLLARAAGGEGGYSPFASPSQSASAVWLTRTGNREPRSFLRIDLATRRLTQVDPRVPLAGRVVRDERGSFWYVQAPEPPEEFHGDTPFCGPAAQGCRLIRASADPFSSRPRTLAPRLTLSTRPGVAIAGLFTDQLALSGDLTREVVRRGVPLRREPLPGITLQLLRNDRPDGSGGYAATGLTTTTDAAGHWSFTLSQPPSRGFYAVLARAAGLQSAAVAVTADAKVTLAAAGTSLSGTVTPAQPGRSVKIQRLDADGNGSLPSGLPRCQKPDAAGQRSCLEEAWITVAGAPLSADGTAFSATAGAPGIYRAHLPADERVGGPPQLDPGIYSGSSPQLRVGG